MDPDFLVRGVLRSVMGGGRKRSNRALRYLTGGHGSFWTHPTTLMTAAGLAWGVFDTLKQGEGQEGQWGGGTAAPAPAPSSAVSTAAGALPPLPSVGTPATTAINDDALRLVRLAISAASADGVMDERERTAVLEQARQANVAEIVESEQQQRRPLAEVVAGVRDPAQCATLYVLAFTILRADEQLTGAERIYLAQLAHLLGLDRETVQQLESDTAVRIDALGDQSNAPSQAAPLQD
jgi:uncharacterized membrane protein YebE (DUF533 family)